MTNLHHLRFVNHFHRLGDGFYTECRPRGLSKPRLIRCDPHAAALLGLTCEDLTTRHCLDFFSGNRIAPECRPLAQAYAGHQFGRFNPSLGDGRVVLLGEVETESGNWEISLKGAGKTPYARQADGHASLNECLREMTVSERLAELEIPATQAMCVLAGDEQVYRQGFEDAAILVRLAPSHIRFGSFENCYYRRDSEHLRQLADHVIEHHYPHCKTAGEPCYAHFFYEVVIRTARLIARWQAAGFVHGMMNTDNQSILGITLDLGESAFTAERDPDFVSSADDEKGRYAFGQQPVIGLWNCNVLARALSPLIADDDLRTALLAYEPEYLRSYEALTA
ncbi:MAG: protein adenylyltransferase SelO family protein [Candidatus Thiodiazotropha sp.]